MDTDVLIVGAGPTGLMLANQLARHGVRAAIIDRHAGPAVETRALGVQARTLEIYAHLGIVDRALELGTRATAANLWAEGRKTARVPVADIGRDLSPYPFVLILGQDDNERLMRDALDGHHIGVQWHTELLGLKQEASRVTATLKQPDGTVADITAAWVAGCDGARSVVRELNAIEFVGAPYEHVFFVADTEMTGSMVPGELNVYLWREGFHLFFPMAGTDHWRVVGILPAELRGRDDLTFEDVMPSLRHETGTDLTFKACSWYSTYRIHHRRAARFRQGRCFLLGDAAHIHSPVGAQGMNTGLQDAYNLAWKLALVVTGRADAALLDSYEAERVPVANRLLETTDRLFQLLVSDSTIAGLLRSRVLARVAAFGMRFEPVRRLAFRTVSQIGIEYRDSPLSDSPAGLPRAAPRAGDRFPWMRVRLEPNGPIEDLFTKLDDTRFNLILFGQSSVPADLPGMRDLVKVHAVPRDSENEKELARLGIPQPSFFLLRPDGHIGLAGTGCDQPAVSRYVSERLHVRA
jgi:2-polyprenyl-6-methoxyphenol hydroxylase-like FAD-dependent oxidoreductase